MKDTTKIKVNNLYLYLKIFAVLNFLDNTLKAVQMKLF